MFRQNAVILIKSSLLLGLLLTMINCNSRTAVQPSQPATLSELVADPETLLVDVRTAEDYAAGSADGAINIPLAKIGEKADYLKTKKNVVIFCNSGRQATEAAELLRQKGVKNLYNAKTLKSIIDLKKIKEMNNIKENITFNNDKPSVFSIKKTEKLKYFAVALGAGAVLKKHTAPVPSTLVVLRGEIKFMINGETHHFREFDVYEIPVDVEHEVVGVAEQNIFTVSQEL